MAGALRADFQSHGINAKIEWINACMQHTNSNDRNTILSQLFTSDIVDWGIPSIPDQFHQFHDRTWRGLFVLQIEEIINLCASSFENKNKDQSVNPKLLRLKLSDGTSTISAMVYQYINGLNLDTPIGAKMVVKDAYVRRGYLILTNGNAKLLDGFADIKSVEEEMKQQHGQLQRQNRGGGNRSNVSNSSNSSNQMNPSNPSNSSNARMISNNNNNNNNIRNNNNAQSHSDHRVNRPPNNVNGNGNDRNNNNNDHDLIQRVQGMQMNRNQNQNRNGMNPNNSSSRSINDGNQRKRNIAIRYDEPQPIRNTNSNPHSNMNRNQNNQFNERKEAPPQMQRRQPRDPPRKLTQKEKLCGFGEHKQDSVFIAPTAVRVEQEKLKRRQPQMQNVKRKSDSWSCKDCTFINTGTDVCEICTCPKGGNEDKENRGNSNNERNDESDSSDDEIEILNEKKVKSEKGSKVFDDIQCDARDFSELNFSNRLQPMSMNSVDGKKSKKQKKKFR